MALRTARGTIEYVCAKKPKPALKLTPVFNEKRGVFVHAQQERRAPRVHRTPISRDALGDAIEHAAAAAALEDPRFPPVQKDELEQITVEVTILPYLYRWKAIPQKRPEKVLVGKHGLIARGMGTSGLLLPQVATEYGWDAKTFLNHTCMKAGLPDRCWTYNTIEILTFEGQIFSEKE